MNHVLFEAPLAVEPLRGPLQITELGDRVLDVIRLLPGLGRVVLGTASSAALSEVSGSYQGLHLTTWIGRLEQPTLALRLGLRALRYARAVRGRADGIPHDHRIEFLDHARRVVHRVRLCEPARVADFDDLVAALRNPFELVAGHGDALAPPLPRFARGSRSDLALADVRTAWYSMVAAGDSDALTRDLGVTRRLILRTLGPQWARTVASDALPRIVTAAAAAGLLLAVAVGNDGCTQTCRGPLTAVFASGFLTMTAPGQRVVIRTDAQHSVWLVREPHAAAVRCGVEVLDGLGNVVVSVGLAAVDLDATVTARWTAILDEACGSPSPVAGEASPPRA